MPRRLTPCSVAATEACVDSLTRLPPSTSLYAWARACLQACPTHHTADSVCHKADSVACHNVTRLTQWPASCPNAYANLWARALMIHHFLGNVPWKPKMKLAHLIMFCKWPSTDDATEMRYSGQRQWHRLTLWPASCHNVTRLTLWPASPHTADSVACHNVTSRHRTFASSLRYGLS